LLVNVGIKYKMKGTVLKCSRCIFTHELVVIIVCTMNVSAEQKSWTRSFIPFHVRMWVWKPVATNEVNDVIALFMLMDITQKPTLQCCFQKIISWQFLSCGCVISVNWFE